MESRNEAPTPAYSDEVLALILRDDEMVTAADISSIVKIHPSVIINRAKNGTWPREVCNYLVSGRRVKFFRIDFLRKGGWIQ